MPSMSAKMTGWPFVGLARKAEGLATVLLDPVLAR